MSRVDLRHLPLRVSLPLLIFMVMLAGLSVSLYLTDRQYKRELIERTTNHANEQLARLVRQSENKVLADGPDIEREIMLYTASNNSAVVIALVEPEGRVLYASHSEWKGKPVALVWPGWDKLRYDNLVRGAGADLRWDAAQRKLSAMMPYAHPPASGEIASSRRGAILMEYDIAAELRQATHKNLQLRLPSVATVVVLTLLLLIWLHRRLTQPMERVSQAAHQIGLGQLQTRVEPLGVGEVVALARTLNQLAGQLGRERDALSAARQAAEQRLERARAENAMISRLLMGSMVGRGDFRAFSWAVTEMLSQHFDVRRVNIWRFTDEGKQLYCIDHYDAETESHSEGMLLREEEYRSEFDALKHATYIDANDAQNDPRVAGYLETYLKPNRITSMLDVVLRLGDRLIGVCCLEHVDREHQWQPEEINFASQIGLLLSSVADEEVRRKSEHLLKAQSEALEKVATERPLNDVLDTLARAVELQFPGMLVSVLLLDEEGRHLHHACAPSLPRDFCQAVDGIAVGEGMASSGTAAWRKQRVVVEDIASDPLWENYRELALQHGLGACWSTPVLGALGQVLGTFAIYYPNPTRPNPQHLRMIDQIVHTAAIAIARQRDESRLRKLSQAVEQSPESIVITDLAGNIEYVNAAFVRNTGFKREEVQGRNPRLRASGKTPKAVFESMWHSIQRGEIWHGEFINRCKDGTERIEEATLAPIRDADGVITHFLSVQQDVTSRREAEMLVHRLAYFDSLTGLANRTQLIERLGAMQAHDAEAPDGVGGLLLIDLDRFKNINNARGHGLGDELLKEFAQRLPKMLQPGDQSARLSADEFAVLLGTLGDDPEKAENRLLQLAEAVQDLAHRPFRFGGDEISVTASIGATLFMRDGADTPIDIMRRADTALHRAKDAGGNQAVLFDDAMGQAMQQRFQIERDLQQAIPGGALRLYLQPQVNAGGKLVGAEALVRWQHAERGLVPPGMFIPVAEESDLIVDLDRWVFTSVCRFLAEQDMAGCSLRVSVNISPRHFRKPGFVGWVRQVLQETGADASLLTLEVTEGLVIDNVNDVIAKMSELTALGFHFSIDDFGTGYSSLAYLKRLPIHELKIDKAFVQDAPTDPDDAALVEVILAVASHLHLKVVAEGVETSEQVAFLNARGNVIHQGYFFGRPEPVEAMAKRCREQAR